MVPTLQIHLLALGPHKPRRLVLPPLGPNPLAMLCLLRFLWRAVDRKSEEIEWFREVSDETVVSEEISENEDVGEEDEQEHRVEGLLVRR